MSGSVSAGQVIGGCRILRRIGEGGMGEVYLAEHLALQNRVAVKILPPSRVSPELVERFFQEARIGSRIQHPNVVTIYDLGHAQNLHYIVMQYVEGKNLSELLEGHGGPLPWRSAVNLIRLAAKGLHAVHQKGLIHRDIKPSNIMLSVDGRVLLMDFGLVRQEFGSDLTQTGVVVGTLAFMSPEQCRGAALDRRSDVYSLGCTLYTLLTGQLPFSSQTEVIAHIAGGRRPRPVSAVVPGIPERLGQIVERAMARNPAERYADARLMGKELTEVVKSSPLDDSTTEEVARLASAAYGVPTAELQLLESTETWFEAARRQPWILGGGVLIVLLLVALVINVLSGGGRRADVAKMVEIPRGSVQLGNMEAEIRRYITPHAPEEELVKLVRYVRADPNTPVVVDRFWIDKYEVSNAQYAEFVKATERKSPSGWNGVHPPSGKEDHPVVNIAYSDAEAYAAWAGKKLPTREQWLRAFRGDSNQLFPWGNEFYPDWANVRSNPQFPSTSPVTATPQDVSRFGVYNMLGNASEFLRGSEVYKGETMRVTNGAYFNDDGYFYGVGSMQVYFTLQKAEQGHPGVGFRCVIEYP
jgi:serine/threonine-protein kinase